MIPSKNIRDFYAHKFVGKTVSFTISHESEDGKSTFVRGTLSKEIFGISMISGWIEKSIKESFTAKILDCGLKIAKNGGRDNEYVYKTYWDYFSEKRKKIIFEQKNGGLLGRLMSHHRGDHNRADLWFKFKDFVIEDFWFDCTFPEEWESERCKDKIDFTFPKGFYKDSKEAIQFFADRSHDDLFGERYFPVAVFNKKTKKEIINYVRWLPKSTSIPIIGKNKLVIGTRCKPSEYHELITYVYENGGKIAKSMEWDWD